MTKRNVSDETLLRLNGFMQHDGWWYAPGDWGDEAGPWPSTAKAIKWAIKHFH